MALLGILVYVLRFEFRPGVTSIVALAHDAWSFGMHSSPARIQCSGSAAILTILGYSINDSIVIMDR